MAASLDALFQISIHALREEGDRPGRCALPSAGISIHALREEGDTSPALTSLFSDISIHALREEGDLVFLGAV